MQKAGEILPFFVSVQVVRSDVDRQIAQRAPSSAFGG